MNPWGSKAARASGGGILGSATGVFPGTAVSACLSCETTFLGVACGASFAGGWGCWAAPEAQTATEMITDATPRIAQRGLSMAKTPSSKRCSFYSCVTTVQTVIESAGGRPYRL